MHQPSLEKAQREMHTQKLLSLVFMQTYPAKSLSRNDTVQRLRAWTLDSKSPELLPVLPAIPTNPVTLPWLPDRLSVLICKMELTKVLTSYSC